MQNTISEDIIAEVNEDLCRHVTINEIEIVFKSMSASKVLGPDGFLDASTSIIWRS